MAPNWYEQSLLFTHIIKIILEVLILSPDDAHGWVRAMSPKHTLLRRQREGGRKTTISKPLRVIFATGRLSPCDVVSSRWAEPDMKPDSSLDKVNFPSGKQHQAEKRETVPASRRALWRVRRAGWVTSLVKEVEIKEVKKPALYHVSYREGLTFLSFIYLKKTRP